MLDEHHYDAYAAARTHLAALARTASDANDSHTRYWDIATALEQLHDPDDLAHASDTPSGTRSDHYEAARAALLAMRDQKNLDPLEANLLIGNLAHAWDTDTDRHTS